MKTIEDIIANPVMALSATTGQPIPERTREDRAEGRDRARDKAAREANAMERQRHSVERLHQPTYPLTAANDNAKQRVAA